MSTRVVQLDLPYAVEVTEHLYVPLADGTRLATRLWLPRAAADGAMRCAAILEYIPYRKRDGTRTRDEPMHGYFAGHGFAVARVDMRGSGESDGLLYDEYLAQEQDDALEVIAWLAARPWCNGAVGMMGKSWGGFNALQVAARQPPALRAILVVGFTDNRFTDDIHYKGGCLLNDNLWWGAIMHAYSARPPDPALVGEAAAHAMWLQRLRELPFHAADWAEHQCYDAYWKHGSVSQDYAAIRVPVFAMDGWADAYTNPVFTLMQHLRVPRRGLVGPWAHVYPHDGVPGPACDFLPAAVQWWRQWLRDPDDALAAEVTAAAAHHKADDGDGGGGVANENKPVVSGKDIVAAGGGGEGNGSGGGGGADDVMQWPMLQVYVEDARRPSATKLHAAGHWVGFDVWPPPQVRDVAYRLHANGALVPQTTAAVVAHVDESDDAATVCVHTPLTHGLACGAWAGFGITGETAGDQRADNGNAVTFRTAPLSQPLVLLGSPCFTVALTCDCAKGMLFAQLCDVAPDGAATRITYGLRNLVHAGAHGDEAVALLQPGGDVVTARVCMDYCGYTVPAGHRVCLSLANNYWPMVWPSPEDTTLMLRLRTATLQLPVLHEETDGEDEAAAATTTTTTTTTGRRGGGKGVRCAGPPSGVVVSAPATPVTVVRAGHVNRTLHYDVLTDTWTSVTDGVGGVFGEGVCRFDDIDTTVEHNLRRELTLCNGDPLSASQRIVEKMRLTRPGWDCDVDIVDTQTSCKAYLHLRCHVVARYNGTVVFERNWYRRVRREAI